MPAQDEQVYVLDAPTMMRLWLTDKVSAGAMTQAQADALWRRYTTETKFVANYFSVGDDLALMTKLARDMRSPLGRVYFKNYGGKTHIILKGAPGLRTILTGTRYGVQNAKVINMGLGRAGVRASARGGTIVSIFLLTAWNIADFVLRDDATLGQLLGGIAGDVSKAALAGGIGYMAGAAVVGTVVGTFALGPLVVAVVVGIGVGLALDWIDNRFQLTQKLQTAIDEGIARVNAEIERQKQGLLDRGANALGNLAAGLIDLAADAAMDYVRRQFNRQSWRFLPRF